MQCACTAASDCPNRFIASERDSELQVKFFFFCKHFHELYFIIMQTSTVNSKYKTFVVILRFQRLEGWMKKDKMGGNLTKELKSR